MDLNNLILRIKRGDSWFFRLLKRTIRAIQMPVAPRLPRFLAPLFRAFYELHFFVIDFVRAIITILYRHPLFQARCTAVGKGLRIEGLPYVNGHVAIHIGDNVSLGGNVGITSARVHEQPRLIIGDHASIGWRTNIAVSQEVVIEEYAKISFDCRISDSDGHPREADLRAQHRPPHAKDIRPVRIGRYAWVGNGAQIMKGVTIGEGAVIASHSVVISDVPPLALAMGNPAEIYFKNFGRPHDKSFFANRPRTTGTAPAS